MMIPTDIIRKIGCIFFIFLVFVGFGSAAEEQSTITIGLPIDPSAYYGEMDGNIHTWNQPIDWNILPYPIMQFSQEELATIMRSYTEKPGIELSSRSGSIQSAEDAEGMRYVSLLSTLPYDPALRNQGSCGNCWVFASMASVELQMVTQEMPDRLSIQAFNSGWTGPKKLAGSWFACYGGTPDWFVEYYLTDGEMELIPWSNEGAAFADASCTLASCTGPQTNFEDIAKIPAYTIDTLTNDRVITTVVETKDAISNIKTLIDNDIPVLLALFFPNREAWQDFYTFWEQGEETEYAFDVTRYAGNAWNYAQGGGHQVLVTGYYEDGETGYFECLNSWGGPKNRPNGTFLIKMDVDYNSKYRNNVLAQMFEALVIDIGEYIQAPLIQGEGFSSHIDVQPGIDRE